MQYDQKMKIRYKIQKLMLEPKNVVLKTLYLNLIGVSEEEQEVILYAILDFANEVECFIV